MNEPRQNPLPWQLMSELASGNMAIEAVAEIRTLAVDLAGPSRYTRRDLITAAVCHRLSVLLEAQARGWAVAAVAGGATQRSAGWCLGVTRQRVSQIMAEFSTGGGAE
jgi:hypothetical protein